MTYRVLADLLVFGHLLFVLFAVFGGLLVLWRPWLAFLHLPAAAWAVLVEACGWPCPLTSWEIRMQALSGKAGAPGGLVENLILPLLYPAGLTPSIQVMLAVLAAAVNMAVYGFVLQRRKVRQAGGES
jgi:hypothetical protein